jgi:CRP-like cAMP-binding protein
MESIKYLINLIAPLPEEEWDYFSSILTKKTIKKKESFMLVDSEVTNFAFISSGLFKLYYVDKSGKEIIKKFAGPGEMIGAYSDYLKGHKSRIGITAITDSVIYEIPTSECMKLYGRHLVWEKIGRRFAELQLIEKEEREYDLVTNTPEENYQKFIQRHKDWSQLIPDYMIASYLGVTSVYLSKIRKYKATTWSNQESVLS